MRKGEMDWLLVSSAILLSLAGLAFIHSVFVPLDQGPPSSTHDFFVHRQALWIALGLVAMMIGISVPFRHFEALAFYFYSLCLLLLVIVLLVKSDHQAHRWIALGGVRFQPSELTKVALIFVWGRILSGHWSPRHAQTKILVSIGLLLIPFLLVVKEPDMGTALMYIVLLLSILYWRGVNGVRLVLALSPLAAAILIIYGDFINKQAYWPFGLYIVGVFAVAYLRRRHIIEAVSLVGANLIFCVLGPAVWIRLPTYQKYRLENFLKFGSEKLSHGWQVYQSKVAIGSGGILGKGYTNGTQKALEFIPAKHTDFIFSVVGEEMGFIGALLLILLYFVIVTRGLAQAAKARSQFASIACVGAAAYFFFQAFINMAMAVGLAPVTGIPLPFVSYGGSSLVISMFLVGFMVNCSLRWREY